MFEPKMIKTLVECPLKSVKKAILKKFPQGLTSVPDSETLKKIYMLCLNNKNPGVASFIMDHFTLDANMVLDNNNARPLHCASACGNLEAIKILVERGATADAKINAGKTEITFWDILYAKGYFEIHSYVKKLIMSKEMEPTVTIPSPQNKRPVNTDTYIIHRRKKQAEEAIPLLPNNTNRATIGKK